MGNGWVVFEDGAANDEPVVNEETGEVEEPLGASITHPSPMTDPAGTDWRARDGESVGWTDAPAMHEWPTAPRMAAPVAATALDPWAMTPRPGVLADVLAEWPDPVEAEPVPVAPRPRAERVARWLVPAAFLAVAGLFLVGTVAG